MIRKNRHKLLRKNSEVRILLVEFYCFVYCFCFLFAIESENLQPCKFPCQKIFSFIHIAKKRSPTLVIASYDFVIFSRSLCFQYKSSHFALCLGKH